MPRKRKNDVTDEQIIETYLSTKSLTKASAALGVGATTMVRVLERRGIERDGFGLYLAARSKSKGEPYIGVYTGSTEDILEWYRSGLSMKAIAAKIGRSVHVVARRVRKAGIARAYQGAGPDHSMWQGGRNFAGEYWRVWISQNDPLASMRTHDGYVLEHRLVMARKLGRPLLPTETVHHIDGDKTNNELQNLQLRQGRHGKHVVMCCLACGSFNIGHAKLADAKPAE